MARANARRLSRRSNRLLPYILVTAALGLYVGCDNDEVTDTDAVAPATVADLAVDSITLNTATLTWTAPGDDGDEGIAESYDLRFSGAAFTASAWDNLEQVEDEPAPQVAGSQENYTATGLVSDSTYYFALRAADEAGNWSGISNILGVSMSDTLAPAAISDLTIDGVTATTVTLAWTAPGDNETVGTAASYDLRYSETSISESDWDDLRQVDGEPAPQVAGREENFTVTGLLPTRTYEFAIKTVDGAGNWSEISNVVSAALESPEGNWIVNPDGSGHSTTIGPVIAIAADGDTIFIAAGTYEEALQINGRSLVLLGAGVSNTVIQYNSLPEDRPLLEVSRGADVTILNMRLFQDFISCGTGVYADSSTLKIEDCALTWCGITANMTDLVLTGCTVWDIPEMTCDRVVPVIGLMGGTARIEQCIIGGYPRVQCGGGVNAVFVCNDFWLTGFGGDCDDPTGSDGNLARDPLFVIGNPAEGSFDFHLRPGSPCLEGQCGQMGAFGLATD